MLLKIEGMSFICLFKSDEIGDVMELGEFFINEEDESFCIFFLFFLVVGRLEVFYKIMLLNNGGDLFV